MTTLILGVEDRVRVNSRKSYLLQVEYPRYLVGHRRSGSRLREYGAWTDSESLYA